MNWSNWEPENSSNSIKSRAGIMKVFALIRLICTIGLITIGLISGHSLAQDLRRPVSQERDFSIAPFSVDITIPIGHRCMGVLPTKSKEIVDPLEAHGFVLSGGDKPIVFLALDWCEVRNGAYDQWRDALAAAAKTDRVHVLVCSLHQHDAPVTDADAQRILDDAGLPKELFHPDFQAECIARAVAAIQTSLQDPRPITHLGTGQARVEKIASNRRVVRENGAVSFSRGSRSGADPFHSSAPDGEIDPYVKTLSFWNGDKPVVALNAYATHPMSYYGQGQVSADFVGLARRIRQQQLPDVRQIYASGCSGDVTAGKYNDGSQQNRIDLTNRLALGMAEAWKITKRIPLTQIVFRSTKMQLPYSHHPDLTEEALTAAIHNESARTEDRILAAMGLASRRRVEAGQPIDVPCIDFGKAQLVLLPGEAFVGYQLMAQLIRPDSFVVTVGYGECWPGYIPTKAAFADKFEDKWLWVAPGSEARMREALTTVLKWKSE
ncbi:MAG: hypothetical protein KDA80_12535 [Planctomycetaceae bacterium]|nr:hypothetical protein [Planctomycetaceae bacterium]